MDTVITPEIHTVFNKIFRYEQIFKTRMLENKPPLPVIILHQNLNRSTITDKHTGERSPILIKIIPPPPILIKIIPPRSNKRGERKSPKLRKKPLNSRGKTNSRTKLEQNKHEKTKQERDLGEDLTKTGEEPLPVLDLNFLEMSVFWLELKKREKPKRL